MLCVCVCGYVRVSASTPGDEKGVWESLELELHTDGRRLPDVAPDAGTDPAQEQ